ncbi:MAG: hypothetical protein JRG97_07455 [Deltaproteobacteria bacterium]|nr:hypothetical protein [Deltaproteobacteria bacterium]MBW2051435.1 hypothetical protein [Deltaproteobacteria bacterium]MBW2140894.1 hypothetical protein [Deltaproteobacteria bacterium]MBW2323347.1 hypothetical protein [Deltaproteobacteria bacterium]
MKKFPPLELGDIKTYSLNERSSKVSVEEFAKPWSSGGSLSSFFDCLPRLLAASDFNQVVDLLARAVRNKKTVILAMGGHPVKVGLAPIIIELIERGILSLLAVNGSVMVHDSEVALVGATSEDVAASIRGGTFGMARETAELIHRAAFDAVQNNLGLGRALGLRLEEGKYPYTKKSVFAAAARLDVPVTVHVALGTDIVHIHPQADGANLGQASLSDFRLFCEAVATLEGGVFINLGSAVILPEVFLKAVSLARNLGHSLENLTTVNMDFIRQYRPQVNVVERPTAAGGQGFNLTGHHELMFPLLAAALIEKLG